jgi:hypothetical protein
LGSAEDSLARLGLALAAVAVPSVFFLRARLNYQRIPPLDPVPSGASPPDCMAVIPARNEERCIARAVRSFPPDTVIVVDDASEDRTAEEASGAGAGVLKAPPLPRGAVGKAHACQSGAAVLTSRWILFADADTWYAPGFFPSIVACAEANNLDFLSAHLTSDPEGFAENLLAPCALALFFCAVNPVKSSVVAFNGQCVLVRNQAYRFVGGHGAVLGSAFEDMRLAELARRHRLKAGMVRARRLGSMRFHAGGIGAGIRRNALRFLAASSGQGIALMTAATTAALWLPVCVWLWISGDAIPAAAVAALPMVWLAGWYRGWRLVLAPAAVCVILPWLYRGMISAMSGSAIEWKGRTL